MVEGERGIVSIEVRGLLGVMREGFVGYGKVLGFMLRIMGI